ncbi:MAG: NAD(P)-dependent oxidoreductase [Steroidobacteraceae bacterium]
MSNKDLVFVALSTFAERDAAPLRLLEQSGRPFRIHQTGKRITTQELLRDGTDAAVIVAGVEPYDAATLAGLPTLRCISRCGVGVDAIDLAAARARDVTVLNTPDVPTIAVAELALSLFLALSRNLRPQADSMRARRWERLESHLINGRTVGLVGFGRIGRRVAQLLQPFGARVLATDPLLTPEQAAALNVTAVGMTELLQHADIVSLHLTRTPGKALIGTAELAAMKQGAILVNLARGEHVDEAALVSALQSGKLAGAGLDVFPREPYDGPLCEFSQVILTPHSATMPVETRSAMELQCVDKALRFLAGAIEPGERVGV